MGRAGRWFAIEDEGVVPDLVTSAKSLGGGLPISAVTGRADVMDAAHVGGLGGTYGGNPVACAAALAVIDAMETEGLLERARVIGERLRERLVAMQQRVDCIGDVRGLGAMVGMELVENRRTKAPGKAAAAAVLAGALERGLLLLKCGVHDNVVRFLVPLVISDDDLGRGLDIVEEALRDASRAA
jgi:4-aminobutyrate aminotransferase/(S)-3-amino-2-methylpropionate transaminase